MKNKFGLFSVVFLLVALIAGAYVLYGVLGSYYDATPGQPAASGNQAAPDFTVFDKGGNAVKLSDFRGTPVVLNFWATWCGPCKNELPDFEAAYQNSAGQVAFLMVNMTDGYQETVAGVKNFISSNGYTFPVYYDTSADAAYAYNVSAIPSTYFIGADGSIVSYHIGMIDAAGLQQGIEGISSGAGALFSGSGGSSGMDKRTQWIAGAVAIAALLGAGLMAFLGMIAERREMSRARASRQQAYTVPVNTAGTSVTSRASRASVSSRTTSLPTVGTSGGQRSGTTASRSDTRRSGNSRRM